MATITSGQSHGASNGVESHVRFIPLSYDGSCSESSALQLVTELRPEWKSPDSQIEFVRFTDGITNTLLKAINKRPGLSKEQIDHEAVLLRAYGHGTDILIDRQRETQNHELLMQHGLAPELLARFKNGMMYRYIRGRVTSPSDLRRPEIYLAVARRLAQWHATVPCLHSTFAERNGLVGKTNTPYEAAVDLAAPGKPPPNVWTVMQKWLLALPTETEKERGRQAELQKEFVWLTTEMSQRPGLGKNGLVFAHCDLLSGNVIVEPKADAAVTNGEGSQETVSFIDYEYATPSPAAFDLANHFAEWGGFDCDYSVLPTRAQRLEFIQEYIKTYFRLLPERPAALDEEKEVKTLFKEVDKFRGAPGFYWGIWALIQAKISSIDFDYASYAETRLGEYEAWRAEDTGLRAKQGTEPSLREKRWAQDE
ncbi:kinase-like domain-containing protein [Pseudomassariella vexata]|uniref:ethanolamine kinase n=1 Tax=Pseudomassariella vexata TaxID=1141098 RepID=A0A1Y2E4I3_9PEZI|nr:kinase-like domain-containing protein [Pseudomassariella vexata]ORY66347.1 kinase-like domain-containing protein [Pseudomassariella vexata]